MSPRSRLTLAANPADSALVSVWRHIIPCTQGHLPQEPRDFCHCRLLAVTVGSRPDTRPATIFTHADVVNRRRLEILVRPTCVATWTRPAASDREMVMTHVQAIPVAA